MAKVGAAVLLWLTSVQAAAAGSIKVADLENGAEVSTCIKIEDYNTKKMDEEMETAERDADSGCCPSGFTPGVKHRNQYLSAAGLTLVFLARLLGPTELGTLLVVLSLTNTLFPCRFALERGMVSHGFYSRWP